MLEGYFLSKIKGSGEWKKNSGIKKFWGVVRNQEEIGGPQNFNQDRGERVAKFFSIPFPPNGFKRKIADTVIIQWSNHPSNPTPIPWPLLKNLTLRWESQFVKARICPSISCALEKCISRNVQVNVPLKNKNAHKTKGQCLLMCCTRNMLSTVVLHSAHIYSVLYLYIYE